LLGSFWLINLPCLPDSVLIGCMFLGIHPFLRGTQVYWHTMPQNSHLVFCDFCGVTYNISSFSYHFISVLSLCFLD
jgi:hypothetical protein